MYPIEIDTMVVMNPANWNQWLTTNRPMPVEPVRSKLMAATVVG